jgi:hypothetical protein
MNTEVLRPTVHQVTMIFESRLLKVGELLSRVAERLS